VGKLLVSHSLQSTKQREGLTLVPVAEQVAQGEIIQVPMLATKVVEEEQQGTLVMAGKAGQILVVVRGTNMALMAQGVVAAAAELIITPLVVAAV
jgi:hypothetical protein